MITRAPEAVIQLPSVRHGLGLPGDRFLTGVAGFSILRPIAGSLVACLFFRSEGSYNKILYMPNLRRENISKYFVKFIFDLYTRLDREYKSKQRA
jgi:hypothetical protein